MKQQKKPTREQKKLMSENKLRWEHWSVLMEDNISITVISKRSGQRRVLLK